MVEVAKKSIEAVFAEAMEMVRNGKKPNISALMRKHGYSKTSARALKVIHTKTWQELLNEYADDELILRRIKQALSAGDHRAALQAADMLLKLKDKYPAGKLKIQAFQEELERVAALPTPQTD